MTSYALVCLSGGMDSATVLGKAVNDYGRKSVSAVSFTYGSKHQEYEIAAAKSLVDFYKIKSHDVIDLFSVFSSFQSNSALLKTGGDIPEGHYEEESMSQTVVHGRNIVFSSILSGYAWARNIGSVLMGIHSGDHAIYPDCRPMFYYSMSTAIMHGTGGQVRMYAPFLKMDKAKILRVGYENGVPYHLTRTCYKNQRLACGKCGACRERLEAFENICQIDPVEYEDADDS